MQLAFDILDTNNDDKVSELDLFKNMYQMCNSGNKNLEHLFSQVLLKDFNDITRTYMQLNSEHRRKLMIENDFDALYVHRLTCFRNMQKLDKNFDRRKEKIIWPIFDCKAGTSIMSGQGRSKGGRIKFGYNRDVFKSIPSVEMVNKLNPIKPKTGK